MATPDDTIAPLRGQELPHLVTRPPGQHSRTFAVRYAHARAPMGPKGRSPGIVYASAEGSNVTCVDGNRYVDLAGGFGAALVGHRHPSVLRAISLQSERLLHALGDVYPSDATVGLAERLTELHPESDAQVVLGQSGSDAVTIALKTACLYTGKPGVVAFAGGYHGLGYGPLAASGFRPSYREPFLPQLNPHVHFAPYPADELSLGAALDAVRSALAAGDAGAVLVEPVLGRGGVIEPPAGFLEALAAAARERGALLVADEIWTGLGRSGKMLCSADARPDLICLGKGLGGGLPLSAVLGRREVMAAWQRSEEVVHTSTFAGAPLACAAGLATLDVLRRERLAERADHVGAIFRRHLTDALGGLPGVRVRGRGLMLGVELDAKPGTGGEAMRQLLEQGYLTTSGGRARECLVLTPPLTIAEPLLEAATHAVATTLRALLP
jgi:4-aminobutyrate aminotransferase / (S)-3-amino-2-methylpropionate transaminase / 5-aminovalerate transaminase